MKSNLRKQHGSQSSNEPVQVADAIRIGSRVTLRDLKTGELEQYTLVEPNAADILQNRISSFTPAGRALYGREAGDVVEIDAPAGPIHVRIESVAEEAPEGSVDYVS